jgi:hypothetical protein
VRPDRVVRQHLRTKFLITTKAGMTWEAILMDADQTSLMLFDAVAIGPDGSRTKADGQVFLPRGDVAYMQKS